MTHTHAIARTLEISRDTWIIPGFAVIAVLFGLYGFFLFGAISNGGKIGRMETQIREESSRLGELEADYMALKQTLSIEEAYELGFISAAPTYLAGSSGNAVAVNR